VKTVFGRMWVYGLIIVCLAVLSSAAFAARREVKVLCDFEGKDWEGKFRPAHVKIERSEEHASQGKACLKVTFAGFRVGRRNRLLYFNLARLGATNWEGWDALEFDVYNPGSTKVSVGTRLTGGVKGRGARILAKTGFTAPPGWHRFSLSTRGPHGGGWYQADPKDVDRSKLSTFWIGIRDRKPEERVLYIDNIRLVNRVPTRLKTLAAALKRIETAWRGMPGTVASAADKHADQLRHLIAGSDSLLKEALGAKDAGQIEEIATEVDELEKQAFDLVDVMAGDTVRNAAAAIEFTVGGNEFGLFPLDEVREAPEKRSLRALEQLHEALAAVLSEARLKASIAERFGDEDFAIGIPASPRAWYYRPQDYSGLVGKEVSLSAARHEYEPFQLVLLPKGRPLSKVSIKASALTGPGTIAAENIEIAPMGWQWFPAEQRWLAVMLRPDIKVFDVDADGQQPVWVNVYVPKETPPGEYRGKLTIRAEGMRSQQVSVRLTVWPFTLPKYPSMKSAGAWALFGKLSADQYDAYARFLIAHRWNPHRLYGRFDEQEHYTYDTFKKWHEWGGTFFNLADFRAISGRFRSSKWHEYDKDGRAVVGARARGFVEKLAPLIDEIKVKDPDFLGEFVVYLSDEPPPSHYPHIDALGAYVKERFGPELKTYFATHHDNYRYMWDAHGISEHIDVWAMQPRYLTPEARDRLHKAGKEILAYNIGGSYMDPVGTRVQFWSYFKDRMDGVLHWNPHQGGAGTPIAGPWEATLFPQEKRTDGGFYRFFPGGGSPRMSTTVFEYWREGLEDVDYLYLLRGLRGKLAAVADGDNAGHKRLLREADRMLNVPETITTGCLGDRIESSGEIIRVIHGTTKDMGVILKARREVADLIVKIQKELVRAGK